MKTGDLFANLIEYKLFDVSGIDGLAQRVEALGIPAIKNAPRFHSITQLDYQGLDNHLYVCARRAKDSNDKGANKHCYYKISDVMVIEHLNMVVAFNQPRFKPAPRMEFKTGMPFY